MATRRERGSDGGFTLIELLVVIIIIGILSAIAIPTFLRQREKGYRAEAVADMKNAAMAVETLATDSPTNSYAAADGADQNSAILHTEGFRPSAWVSLTVTASATSYCIEGENEMVPGKTFVFRSESGRVQIGTSGLLTCA